MDLVRTFNFLVCLLFRYAACIQCYVVIPRHTYGTHMGAHVDLVKPEIMAM